jgi:hypothetical protein
MNINEAQKKTEFRVDFYPTIHTIPGQHYFNCNELIRFDMNYIIWELFDAKMKT